MPDRTRLQPPPPLVVACSLAALQGLFFVGYGVLEISHTDAARLTMGVTTTAFFTLYGVALLLCGWRLARLDSWARSPVVLAQLILLGLAWNFWGDQTRVVSVALLVVALVVLAGVFHPASVEALAEDAPGDDPRR